MVTENVRELSSQAAATGISSSDSASYTLIQSEKSPVRMMHGDVKYIKQGSHAHIS
jgi:hypothetical protein